MKLLVSQESTRRIPVFILSDRGKSRQHPENCIFLGPKTREDVRNWISASDCLLLPSYSEGFPTVIMEAFACGIPVIASNVGGSADVWILKKQVF